MPDPTVYIVDDDDAVRQMLSWLMTSVKLPVAEYASADDFLADYKPDLVGCVLLDVRMPGMSGLELQRKLNQASFDLPIIIITGHGDVSMAVEGMKNGAFDFIEKPFNNQDLLDVVHKGINENVRHSKKKAKIIERKKMLSLLTSREGQVLSRLIKGETNKVIARNLGVTQKTIEAHRANVMKKLAARSLADLIEIAG